MIIAIFLLSPFIDAVINGALYSELNGALMKIVFTIYKIKIGAASFEL